MYVIYKQNNIPGIGYVNPEGIPIGLASYGEWILAECPKDKIMNYSEFGFIVIPNEIATGLMLNDAVVEETESPENTNFIISESDEILIKNTKEYISKLEEKLKLRANIATIKDREDDLVDMKKMLDLLIVYAISDWNNKSEDEKNRSKFRSLFDLLSIEMYDDLINFESDINFEISKINKVIEQENIISEKVNAYLNLKNSGEG